MISIQSKQLTADYRGSIIEANLVETGEELKNVLIPLQFAMNLRVRFVATAGV